MGFIGFIKGAPPSAATQGMDHSLCVTRSGHGSQPVCHQSEHVCPMLSLKPAGLHPALLRREACTAGGSCRGKKKKKARGLGRHQHQKIIIKKILFYYFGTAKLKRKANRFVFERQEQQSGCCFNARAEEIGENPAGFPPYHTPSNPKLLLAQTLCSSRLWM